MSVSVLTLTVALIFCWCSDLFGTTVVTYRTEEFLSNSAKQMDTRMILKTLRNNTKLSSLTLESTKEIQDTTKNVVISKAAYNSAVTEQNCVDSFKNKHAPDGFNKTSSRSKSKRTQNCDTLKKSCPNIFESNKRGKQHYGK